MKEVTLSAYRDGRALMTYLIAEEAGIGGGATGNNSKFYEGVIKPDTKGTWSWIRRWGALADVGSRADGKTYDKHGLTETVARKLLIKERLKRAKRGYKDAFKSRPVGQYPVGLDRPGRSGPWGQQGITQCVPDLRRLSLLLGVAQKELAQDDAGDLFAALIAMENLAADLASSNSMAAEVKKRLRPPLERMRRNPRFIDDPGRTEKELRTLKRYIDSQLKECNI
jgi:hypothetical protein